MTVNLLIDGLLSKGCTMAGKYGDATPFTEYSVNVTEKIIDEYGKILQSNGFDEKGWETMASGYTGEEFKAKIFVCPTYYQRLKHLVSDKMHARATGDITNLTRQAPEGRSRDGGLRCGEVLVFTMPLKGETKFSPSIRKFKIRMRHDQIQGTLLAA